MIWIGTHGVEVIDDKGVEPPCRPHGRVQFIEPQERVFQEVDRQLLRVTDALLKAFLLQAT